MGMKERFIHFISFKCQELNEKYREDVYHEAFMLLQQNILQGVISVDTLTTTLLAYLEGIGFRVAMKMIRETDVLYSDGDEWEKLMKEKSKEYVVPEDNYMDSERDSIVREVVKNFPDPCGKILTGIFWDEWSVATIKFEMKYASYEVARNQKSKCLGKIKFLVQEKLKQCGYDYED